jgi:hypothetical protein
LDKVWSAGYPGVIEVRLVDDIAQGSRVASARVGIQQAVDRINGRREQTSVFEYFKARLDSATAELGGTARFPSGNEVVQPSGESHNSAIPWGENEEGVRGNVQSHQRMKDRFF